MQVGAKTARLRRRILIAEQRAATAEGAMETRMPDDTAAAVRRTDLDWLRIGAFGVLIVFHVGMFYVPWEWEVKSPRLVPWLQIPMEWSAPWRLLLLFIVSGAATRFMSTRLSAGAL